MLFKVWDHLNHYVIKIIVHLLYGGIFIFSSLKINWNLGVVAHVCNIST